MLRVLGACWERAGSVLGACWERRHGDVLAVHGSLGKWKVLDFFAGVDGVRDGVMRDDDGKSKFRGWRFWVNRMLGGVCGVVLCTTVWQGMGQVEFAGGVWMPDVAALGAGVYALDSVGTMGEVIEREGLRGRSMAVWGGKWARMHDLPFRWRVTADWFLLPEKGVPVVATTDEAMEYEYILSPWYAEQWLKKEGYRIEQLAGENHVWLYRVWREEGGE